MEDEYKLKNKDAMSIIKSTLEQGLPLDSLKKDYNSDSSELKYIFIDSNLNTGASAFSHLFVEINCEKETRETVLSKIFSMVKDLESNKLLKTIRIFLRNEKHLLNRDFIISLGKLIDLMHTSRKSFYFMFYIFLGDFSNAIESYDRLEKYSKKEYELNDEEVKAICNREFDKLVGFDKNLLIVYNHTLDVKLGETGRYYFVYWTLHEEISVTYENSSQFAEYGSVSQNLFLGRYLPTGLRYKHLEGLRGKRATLTNFSGHSKKVTFNVSDMHMKRNAILLDNLNFELPTESLMFTKLLKVDFSVEDIFPMEEIFTDELLIKLYQTYKVSHCERTREFFNAIEKGTSLYAILPVLIAIKFLGVLQKIVIRLVANMPIALSELVFFRKNGKIFVTYIEPPVDQLMLDGGIPYKALKGVTYLSPSFQEVGEKETSSIQKLNKDVLKFVAEKSAFEISNGNSSLVVPNMYEDLQEVFESLTPMNENYTLEKMFLKNIALIQYFYTNRSMLTKEDLLRLKSIDKVLISTIGVDLFGSIMYLYPDGRWGERDYWIY